MLTSRLITLLALTSLAAPSWAQSANPGPMRWSLRTQIRVTGTSESSEPAGYKVYSAVGLGVTLRRDLGRRLAVELASAAESRELERRDVRPAVNLGSVESLPLTAVILVSLRPGAAVNPYIGGGGNLTLFWEKSGSLDSDGLSPSLGPALAAGVDVRLRASVVLNLAAGWYGSTTHLDAAGTRLATLRIHPASLAAGVGLRW